MFEFIKMNMEQSFLLKMVVYAFALLSLVRFPSILASGFEIHSKVCGTAHLAYSHFHGHQLFYLNRKYVDNNSFCKALCFHYANDCIFEGQHGCRCNGFDLSSADLPLKRRRKLLQKDVAQDEPSKEKKKSPTGFSNVKQVSVAATGILAICCGLLCPCFHRKRKATSHTALAKDPISMDSGSSFENTPVSEKVPPSPFRVPPSPRFSASPQVKRVGSVRLDLNQIVRATQNFSPSLRIGEGGFGTVYKGQLENGQVVAVKRARKEHCESLRTEFRNEIELLSKIDHRSLVKLLGYIEQGDERLIVTEYVPSGTLREHLDGQRGRVLDFSQRLEIAIDVAHALTYLHTYSEKQIIHRDVKSSNILLTESKRAKVADFGFARLGPMDSDKTHISTTVKGTLGYLDPEYMRTYQLTPRSDVYSFGMLLIEILTGRRPVEVKRPTEEHVTIRWAFRKYGEGAVVDMVDPLMEERVHGEVLMKIFALAFECAAPIRMDRPDMKTVGEKLWVIRADYVRSKKA